MNGQGKPARNWARAIVATVGILAASAIVAEIAARTAVSYTHLTLPTIYSV